MIDVGLKDANPGSASLELVDNPDSFARPQMPRSQRPVEMPRLPEGHVLFGTRDQGFGERLYLCETLADAQALWDAQDTALASPVWYSAPVLFAGDN